MNRLARDEMAEPVSRDQLLRSERGQENIPFSCCVQLTTRRIGNPYMVDPYSALSDDHT